MYSSLFRAHLKETSDQTRQTVLPGGNAGQRPTLAPGEGAFAPIPEARALPCRYNSTGL
ncbi:MAG: hypothetical protein AAF871_02875 [Pseudomonadota bacterium]